MLVHHFQVQMMRFAMLSYFLFGFVDFLFCYVCSAGVGAVGSADWAFNCEGELVSVLLFRHF